MVRATLLVAGLALLGACDRPPASAYVSVASGAAGQAQIEVGRTSTKFQTFHGIGAQVQITLTSAEGHVHCPDRRCVQVHIYPILELTVFQVDVLSFFRWL